VSGAILRLESERGPQVEIMCRVKARIAAFHYRVILKLGVSTLSVNKTKDNRLQTDCQAEEKERTEGSSPTSRRSSQSLSSQQEKE
jgi:hypothetical protein